MVDSFHKGLGSCLLLQVLTPGALYSWKLKICRIPGAFPFLDRTQRSYEFLQISRCHRMQGQLQEMTADVFSKGSWGVSACFWQPTAMTQHVAEAGETRSEAEKESFVSHWGQMAESSTVGMPEFQRMLFPHLMLGVLYYDMKENWEIQNFVSWESSHE